MKWTPLQKLSITTGAALLLLGLGGIVSYFYASRLIDADRAVAQTNSNIATAYQLMSRTHDAERITKAYVVRPDSATKRDLDVAQSDVEDAVDALRRSTEDNPRQRTLLDRATPNVASSFREYRAAIVLRDRVGLDSARRYLVRESPLADDSLFRIVGQMREEELRVLAERARHQASTGTTALRLILLGTALTFLLAGLALQPMRAEVAARLTTRIASVVPVADEQDGGAALKVAEERLEALQRLVHALAPAHDVAAGARALVELGAAPAGAALAAVIVPNGAGGFTVLHATSSSFDAVPAEVAGAVAEALRAGDSVVVESRAARERQFGTLAGLDTLGATGALLLVPLMRKTIAKGVLLLGFGADHVFGDDELAYAATLGRLGGAAVASPSFPN